MGNHRAPFFYVIIAVLAACNEGAQHFRERGTSAIKPSPSPTPVATTNDQRKQCFGIVNGTVTSDYASVVHLLFAKTASNGQITTFGSCTGTFVSSTTLITAAHCVDATATGSVYYESSGSGQVPSSQEQAAALVAASKKPTQVFRLADVEAHPELGAQDLAILVFPKGTAPAISKLLLRSAKTGEKATIVGYGVTTTDPNAQTTDPWLKRVGYNEIALGPTDPQSQGMVYTIGAAKQQTGSVPATTAPGDSGGPLFIDGMLAATTQSGGSLIGDSSQDVAKYVDLASSAIQTFMQNANAKGANIPLTQEQRDRADAEMKPPTPAVQASPQPIAANTCN